MRRPTIRDARVAYNAARNVDTADTVSQGDGQTIRGTYALRGNTRMRLALKRLLDRLEHVNDVAQKELVERQRELDDADDDETRRDVARKIDDFLAQELDDATFEEVDPERYGLRLSALGWKAFDRVTTNVWKDLGPWFIEDKPDEEITEEGAANRADRRG